MNILEMWEAIPDEDPDRSWSTMTKGGVAWEIARSNKENGRNRNRTRKIIERAYEWNYQKKNPAVLTVKDWNDILKWQDYKPGEEQGDYTISLIDNPHEFGSQAGQIRQRR